MKLFVYTIVVSLFSVSVSASTIKCYSQNGALEISTKTADSAMVSLKVSSSPGNLLTNFKLDRDDGGGYDDSPELGHAQFSGYSTSLGNTLLPRIKVNIFLYEKSNGNPQVSITAQEKNLSLKFESCIEEKTLSEKMGYSNQTLLTPY